MLAMSNQPDVVLMDINLEGAAKASRPLGGFAVCARHLSFSSRAILTPTPSRAFVSKFLEPACYPKRLIVAASPRRWQQWPRAITKANTMAAPDRFIAWCKQEQASIEQQLELLKAGKVRTGENIGAGWIDTTNDSIERAKARLAELDDLLTEAGKATVVRDCRVPRKRGIVPYRVSQRRY